MNKKDKAKIDEKAAAALKELEQKYHIASTSKSANIRLKTETVADIIDVITELL